ncbi:MAG: 50S ribosomal protein L28 [Armatimonadetes bacterium]|nr:50S ribosomal protein L28 [Armatimonadota bacterium]
MAKICQVTGKKGQKARHVRHRHSGPWKFRAPRKNRRQLPNLQTVTVRTPGGKVRLKVSTKVIKSAEFAAVLSGRKPMPKAWRKKPTYED